VPDANAAERVGAVLEAPEGKLGPLAAAVSLEGEQVVVDLDRPVAGRKLAETKLDAAILGERRRDAAPADQRARGRQRDDERRERERSAA
jgi:hypothetical protein